MAAEQATPSVLEEPDAGRIERAMTQVMAVTEHGPGIYEVVGTSDEPHMVDLWTVGCTCPDFMYRGRICKHVLRVIVEVNELPGKGLTIDSE